MSGDMRVYSHSHSNHGGHSLAMNPSFRTSSALLPTQRKPLIVEMLLLPPPLEEELHLPLLRNPLVLLRSLATDWSDIQLSELNELNKLISIPAEMLVQEAFETLQKHNLTSLPVGIDLPNCFTFDYLDLNTYLLMVMGKIDIEQADVAARAKRGENVPVLFINKLHPKNPFIRFNENDYLTLVMETLGNGVHRVAVTDDNGKVTGILSQRRLIRYVWENARRFPSLQPLFNQTLEELKIGSTNPMTIYEDQLLIEALQKMFNDRVLSLAVIDRTRLLIGNILITDVQNVLLLKNSHLLFKLVLNFISYNLSQKGIEQGQDQYPIFHVNNQLLLGRVVAKLVATQSHRLWIVDTPRSTPGTPQDQVVENQGKLIGVVTLTDILGLFAETKGKKTDPTMARNQRRRSSTSTTRSSIDEDVFRK